MHCNSSLRHRETSSTGSPLLAAAPVPRVSDTGCLHPGSSITSSNSWGSVKVGGILLLFSGHLALTGGRPLHSIHCCNRSHRNPSSGAHGGRSAVGLRAVPNGGAASNSARLSQAEASGPHPGPSPQMMRSGSGVDRAPLPRMRIDCVTSLSILEPWCPTFLSTPPGHGPTMDVVAAAVLPVATNGSFSARRHRLMGDAD